MAHSIQRAPTGRAKCRACKQPVDKGAFRLGEEVPNAFGEGTATHWYHLECGARQRAEAFLEAWASVDNEEDAEVLRPQGEALLRTAELGTRYYRLQRFIKAERAPSGRARCQGCRELIQKGALRIVLQRIEDGMASGAGFVHVGCAHAYAGAVDELVARITGLSELDEESFREVEASVARQAEFERVVKVPYHPGGESDSGS